ncbi:MAG: hypothetical protein ACLR23_08075 [Clostridia bacterium]
MVSADATDEGSGLKSLDSDPYAVLNDAMYKALESIGSDLTTTRC